MSRVKKKVAHMVTGVVPSVDPRPSHHHTLTQPLGAEQWEEFEWSKEVRSVWVRWKKRLGKGGWKQREVNSVFLLTEEQQLDRDPKSGLPEWNPALDEGKSEYVCSPWACNQVICRPMQ